MLLLHVKSVVRKNVPLILFVFLYLSLLSAVPAMAQKEDSLRQVDGVFYIYPHKFALRLVYQQRQLPFTLEPLSGGRKVSYQPNSRRTLGVGGSLFGISYTLSFMLPESLQRNAIVDNDITQRDLRINAFHRRLGLQLDRQQYKGYYLNNINELDDNWQGGEEYPYRKDLEVKRFGVGISYLFQPERFSYSAALNNRKKQFKGGGTFFLQVYGGHLKVGGDSLLLPRKYFENAGTAGRVDEVNVYHASLMPGYAHTFVLGRFYLMTSLALGPEVQKRNISEERNTGEEVQWSAEGRLQMQAAVGYDDHTYFWNLAYNTQRQQYEINDLGVGVNTNGIRLLVGRRFDEFGFMRRLRNWSFYQKLRGEE